MDEAARPEDDHAEPGSPDDVSRGSRAVSRRAVVAAGLAAGGAALAAAMIGRSRADDPGRAAQGGPTVPPAVPRGRGRLQARPEVPHAAPPPPGMHPLGLGAGRDGLLYVPAGYRPDVPAPLVVALHGAGGDASGGIGPLRTLADASGLVLVAPESRGRSWDVIVGDYGPDVAFIDEALRHVFSGLSIDGERMVIEGFSDGASYALSLGLANGDLFTHCVAFSPGFLAEPTRQGRLRAFVTHGVHDTVLPIDRCSRRIVPALRRDGYDVDYREFDGGHVVPPELAQAAVGWLAAPS